MKRKTIVVNIMSILLCVCAVVVGVFCTQIVTLNMSGSISYEVLLPLFYDETYGWHIQMGKVTRQLATAVGVEANTPLKWIPVIEEKADGTLEAFDYTEEDNKPQTGHSYYFLSYNILPVMYGETALNDIVYNFSFKEITNETTGKYESYSCYYDGNDMVRYTTINGDYIDSNDYSTSNVRNYLNGAVAYHTYDSSNTTSGYFPDLTKQLTSFLELYNLNNDDVYLNKITPRTLGDLYATISSTFGASNLPETTINSSDTEDKLWLMSKKEWDTCYTNGFASTQSLMAGTPVGGSESVDWWTRTFLQTQLTKISSSGNLSNYGVFYWLEGLRPAFKIEIQ